MTTTAAAEPRIHELLLENLFAVFGEREQPPAVNGVDGALVRDGRIAVLHTLLTAQS